MTVKALRRAGRISLVAAALIATVSCGDSGGSAGEDIDSKPDRAIDRSPFEMAQPQVSAASTTIPGEGPTLPAPTVVDPATGATVTIPTEPGQPTDDASGTTGPSDPVFDPTIPPSTTTTTIYRPVRTEPYADLVCAAAQQFALTAEAFAPLADPPSAVDAQQAIVAGQLRLRKAAELFAASNAPDTASATGLLAERSRSLADQLGGVTTTQDDFKSAVSTVLAGFFGSADSSMSSAFFVMSAHLNQACPDLLVSFRSLPRSAYSPQA